MRFVEVDKERFFDVMQRCGAYIGEYEKGYGHYKELFCRNLSAWQGETVVGVFTKVQGQPNTFSIAGYLDDYYK